MSRFKNWKSTLAFIVFVGAYVFTLVEGKPVGIVDIAGYIALYSSLFMMLRSEMTSDMIGRLIDNIDIKRK